MRQNYIHSNCSNIDKTKKCTKSTMGKKYAQIVNIIFKEGHNGAFSHLPSKFSKFTNMNMSTFVTGKAQ